MSLEMDVAWNNPSELHSVKPIKPVVALWNQQNPVKPTKNQ